MLHWPAARCHTRDQFRMIPTFPHCRWQGCARELKRILGGIRLILERASSRPVTRAGSKSREAEAIFAPISVRGRSVADIGAWNGGLTIEAKRRGASKILAIDDYTWSHPHFRGKETFELVMSRLGIEAESKVLDIQEADNDLLGRWQVVLFLGVFYHLLDPIAALKRLADMTEEVLVIETHMDLEDSSSLPWCFIPIVSLEGMRRTGGTEPPGNGSPAAGIGIPKSTLFASSARGQQSWDFPRLQIRRNLPCACGGNRC